MSWPWQKRKVEYPLVDPETGRRYSVDSKTLRRTWEPQIPAKYGTAHSFKDFPDAAAGRMAAHQAQANEALEQSVWRAWPPYPSLFDWLDIDESHVGSFAHRDKIDFEARQEQKRLTDLRLEEERARIEVWADAKHVVSQMRHARTWRQCGITLRTQVPLTARHARDYARTAWKRLRA